MTTMPELEVFVTLGIDTHKDVHVAVALDQLGRWLDTTEIPTTAAGYARLLGWASELGTIERVGIEGTGSHGAGLARWLTARGLVVVEVNQSLGRPEGVQCLLHDPVHAVITVQGVCSRSGRAMSR